MPSFFFLPADSLLSLSVLLFGHDWSMCQVWWGFMVLERVCSSVMWLQQMAQLSIRVGSPAVCSPVSCFTAIKYHRGSAKQGQMGVCGEKSHKGGKSTFNGGGGLAGREGGVYVRANESEMGWTRWRRDESETGWWRTELKGGFGFFFLRFCKQRRAQDRGGRKNVPHPL